MSDEVSKKTKKSKKEKKIDSTISRSSEVIQKGPSLRVVEPNTNKSGEEKKKKPQDRDTSNNEKPNLDIEPPPRAAAQALEKDRKDRKKSKKKPLERDNVAESPAVPVEQTAMNIDAPSLDTVVERKKDHKRRRRLEDDADVAKEPLASPPKRQKKSKRAKHVESESHSQTSMPATSPKDTSHTAVLPTNPTDSFAFLTKHSVTIRTPASLPSVVPVISFDQLQVPEPLKVAFKNFEEPTPIQACTWPPALQGRDVVGIAETGSGKTLAFGIPALAQLISTPDMEKSKKSESKSKSKPSSSVSVLVVAPTRELALQTHDALSTLGAPFNISSVAVFGGVDKAPQIKALRSEAKDGKATRIVVGTPGRILDLVNEGACDLSRVSYLVLDEADRMLDKGFENDIRKIISFTEQGPGRQTMMFSATWPESVRRLASTFLRDPVRVTVGSDDLTANSRVEQIIEVFDDPREKDSRLAKTLKALSHKKISMKGSPESRILVFALYKKEASRVESMLRQHGYSVGALHGDMAQSARINALEKFKTGETGILVATDVAARGLDIPNVGVVINYTFPLTIEDYIHRIGRTGRGGRTGKSITFFTGENHERSLAGELARVLRDSHFDEMADRLGQFPMTIKKKTHGSYGAFFRDDITGTATKIVFD